MTVFIAVDRHMTTTDGACDALASLDPKSVALLLDVDGTLIDIGPSPFEVHVPDTLIATLERLCALTGGALGRIILADLLRWAERYLSALDGPAAVTEIYVPMRTAGRR
jgi:hypothetical protein